MKKMENKEILRVQLVDYCNHKCFFCHNEGSKVQKKKINRKLMERVIQIFESTGGRQLTFTGGEPTLHPEIVDIIQTAKDNYYPRMNIGLTTNGTNIKKILSLIKNDYIDKINISLYTLDKAEHKRITGTNTLSTIIDGLELLAGINDQDVAINYVVQKDKINELEGMYNFVSAFGFRLNVLNIIGIEQDYQYIESLKEKIGYIRQKYNDSTIKLKSKIYHPKCRSCKSKPICGEGSYLRMNVDNVLVPCLYRKDLLIQLEQKDTNPMLREKILEGMYRLENNPR